MSLPPLARCAVFLFFLLPISSTPADPAPSHAEPAQAPTADEVINRHIEAIGGRAAIDAIQTMRYERTYVHIEEERIYHRLVHKKRPGKGSNCAVDTGSCFIVDGNRSWTKTVNPEDGSVEWSEDEYLGSQSNNFEVRFGPFIDYHEKGITVEFVETATIDGVQMHRLRMEMANGAPWDIYFDVETGLWSRFVTPGGGTVTIHDYRPVGNILFPRLTEVKGTRRDGTAAHHLNTTISIELNVPMEDSLFRPDPAMQ
jgi:hypothetical protein